MNKQKEGDHSQKIISIGNESRTFLHVRDDMSINSTSNNAQPYYTNSSNTGDEKKKLFLAGSQGHMSNYMIEDAKEADNLS
jgi:hypothetical protein